MNSNEDARERILALERIRVVETKLIQCSLPLIRRLVEDLTLHLGNEFPSRWHQWLLRGESWWRPANNQFAADDPRRFPVVQEVIGAIEEDSAVTWQPDHSPRDGVCYLDLIEPVSRQLELRTELARVAGLQR
ncbi:MAG: hypothetical protein HOK60_04180 [Planctomycetes bacterium]|nr:hypothetical protein [Planctomycetota bacterium]MBT6968707.1 hypothetical protein [Planctomycetota bacterium]MBT7641060.1 hypothetical protein [Planctomycetota bacterium]